MVVYFEKFNFHYVTKFDSLFYNTDIDFIVKSFIFTTLSVIVFRIFTGF